LLSLLLLLWLACRNGPTHCHDDNGGAGMM
jgi:hypothetical protein